MSKVKISTHHLYNPKLSLKAKGLFSCILASTRNDFNMKDLFGTSTNGRDSVYAAVNELKKYGYITSERVMSEEGKYEGIQYYVHPTARDIEK